MPQAPLPVDPTQDPHPGSERVAAHLLAALPPPPRRTDSHRNVPAPSEDRLEPVDWAASGAMALTGPAAGPPRLAPAAFARVCRGAAHALDTVAFRPGPLLPDPPALLGERAAFADLERGGKRAPGGACRILRAADGWLALNLARAADFELLPAWLETGGSGDAWGTVAAALPQRAVATWVERGRLIGLPVAPVQPPPDAVPAWVRVSRVGPRLLPPTPRAPRVVDFSGLWAGPLATHFLGVAGADVVKVESRVRPDGARRGPTGFFDLLNAGKRCVSIDPLRDQRVLLRLLDWADLVVEASRPRALAHWGIDAEAWLRQRPGRNWLTISGYGRREPFAQWVAFGDDATAAAGLPWAMSPDSPIFCGDALADPLAGLLGAVAALGAHRSGGGLLLDLSLRDVVAHTLTAYPASRRAARIEASGKGGFEVHAGKFRQAVLAPRARTAAQAAPELGAHDREWHAERGPF